MCLIAFIQTGLTSLFDVFDGFPLQPTSIGKVRTLNLYQVSPIILKLSGNSAVIKKIIFKDHTPTDPTPCPKKRILALDHESDLISC